MKNIIFQNIPKKLLFVGGKSHASRADIKIKNTNESDPYFIINVKIDTNNSSEY